MCSCLKSRQGAQRRPIHRKGRAHTCRLHPATRGRSTSRPVNGRAIDASWQSAQLPVRDKKK
jgi:hypothetical protein